LRAFTLYGATRIVAWATRLLADRAESFGGREAAECLWFQIGTLKLGQHFRHLPCLNTVPFPSQRAPWPLIFQSGRSKQRGGRRPNPAGLVESSRCVVPGLHGGNDHRLAGDDPLASRRDARPLHSHSGGRPPFRPGRPPATFWQPCRVAPLNRGGAVSSSCKPAISAGSDFFILHSFLLPSP